MQHDVPERLIIRYLSNQATQEEEQTLFKWLEQDAGRHAILGRYRNAWNAEIKRPSFEVDRALGKLNARIDAHERKPGLKKMATLNTAWRMAAALAFILLAASVVNLWQANQLKVNIGLRETATVAGQKYRMRLSDGTRVRLNSRSSLKTPKNFERSSLREVYLTGEAFFEVSKDSLRPFIIYTGDIQTRVLGTAFNIKSTDTQIEVSVAEGRVAVHYQRERAELMPNEKITYTKSTRTWKKHKTNLTKELAWQANTLIFEDQPLDSVAQALADWYGVRISLQNESLGRCRLTGTFTNEKLDAVMKAITFSLGMEYQIQNKEVKISGHGCK